MNKYLILLLVVFAGCRSVDKDRLIKDMYSINADKAGRAAYNAGETEDTVFIKHLMYHLNDPRVTYSYKHYGMRISTIKISALYTIHDIEYEPSDRYKIDTIALHYWINKYPHYYIPYQY